MEWEITSGDDAAAIVTLTKDKRTLDLSTATVEAVMWDYKTTTEYGRQTQSSLEVDANWAVGIVVVRFPLAKTNLIPTGATRGKVQIIVTKDGYKTSWWLDKVIYRLTY